MELIVLFAHGLGSHEDQKNIYQEAGFFPTRRVIACEFPDGLDESHSLSTIGQDSEIEILVTAYEHIRDRWPASPVMLYGVSRGAATVINAVGSGKLRDAAALVLESPFDCVKSVVQADLQSKYGIGWIPGLPALVHRFLVPRWYPEYNPSGIQPNAVITKLPDIPILMIASQQDRRVPVRSTAALYSALMRSAHDDAHMLVLQHGVHGGLVDGPDAERYKHAVLAFYERYNVCEDV